MLLLLLLKSHCLQNKGAVGWIRKTNIKARPTQCYTKLSLSLSLLKHRYDLLTVWMKLMWQIKLLKFKRLKATENSSWAWNKTTNESDKCKYTSVQINTYTLTHTRARVAFTQTALGHVDAILVIFSRAPTSAMKTIKSFEIFQIR